MPATAFLPHGDIGRAPGELSTEEADDAIDLARYFQRKYVGDLAGG